ncbi:hypothetical protein HDV05_002550 [Chytridiales sp. JEL 0842]|nr:hypothetical protein HDV05_002550 [Chytridiales sp. JEL 0842]
MQEGTATKNVDEHKASNSVDETHQPSDAIRMKRNIWDRFPREIRTDILDLSDPLTQHLHDHGEYALEMIEKLSSKYKKKLLYNDIWEAALEMEWPGDLGTLPGSFQPSKDVEWYYLVTSKSMYERLCQLDWFKRLPSTTDGDTLTSRNIPMRNCWPEYLDDPFDDPDKHIREAVVGAHLYYMLHLNDLDIVDDYTNLWEYLAESLAREGLENDLLFLIYKRGVRIYSDVTDAAAASGDRELFDMLHDNYGCSDMAVVAAAKAGDLEMLKYLCEELELDLDHDAMIEAAKNGRLDVVKHLHENFHESVCSSQAMDAAHMETLDVIKYLHENCDKGCTTKAMDAAALNDCMEAVFFLHENRTEGCTTAAMDGAAENGHLDVVKWLAKNRREGFTKNGLDTAGERGHLEVVECLQQHLHLLQTQ